MSILDPKKTGIIQEVLDARWAWGNYPRLCYWILCLHPLNLFGYSCILSDSFQIYVRSTWLFTRFLTSAHDVAINGDLCKWFVFFGWCLLKVHHSLPRCVWKTMAFICIDYQHASRALIGQVSSVDLEDGHVRFQVPKGCWKIWRKRWWNHQTICVPTWRVGSQQKA